MQQQYSLRWNNYFRHLTYALDSHRCNDDFVDVTLCCDGQKIKAHKVVLSSCSTYFKEIFKENPHPHPIIIFKMIKYEDLNSIIEFMYQGEVNVQQEALQSFLQTAELLSVQGLTAEEKEKPKTAVAPEHKLIKTIPSTIRTINESNSAIASGVQAAATATTQQSATQTTAQIDLPATILQPPPLQQTQHIQHIQQHHHNQQQQQTQLQQQIATNTVSLPMSTSSSSSNNNSLAKKRKITFSDEDDNIYTTETVEYGVVKDEEPTIVKTAAMTFLRGNVKMDMPEYIVSEVEDSDPMTDDGGVVQQSSQDDGSVAGGQSVTQYTSEYEILTESEIDEKYTHGDEGNTEITIEMSRLLNSATAAGTTTQGALDDAAVSDAVANATVSIGGGTVTGIKTDSKASGTTDLPHNKWTECQFCKMVITTVNLWRHIRTQHTPQPPRKCDLCNKNFKNKYSLREHIRISHEQKITVKTEN